MNREKYLDQNENLDIDLQVASPLDIPKIIEIEKSVSGDKTYSPILTEEEWQEAFKKVKTFLIKNKNDLVGEVSYEIKDSEHSYIDGLVIKPEFQGKGFARKAMEKIMEELKIYKRIDLVTHPKNKRAIRLYESLGFKIEKQVENYFGDGEPRIVMVFKK